MEQGNGKNNRQSGSGLPFEITSIAVLATCTDHKLRLVALKPFQARQLFRAMKRITGNKVSLLDVPKKKNPVRRFFEFLVSVKSIQ